MWHPPPAMWFCWRIWPVSGPSFRSESKDVNRSDILNEMWLNLPEVLHKAWDALYSSSLTSCFFPSVNRVALIHECMGLRFWGLSPHSGQCLRSSCAAALISSILQKLTPGARRSWRTRTSCCSFLTSETCCHSCISFIEQNGWDGRCSYGCILWKPDIFLCFSLWSLG